MPTIRQTIAVEKLSEIIRKAKGQKKVTMGRILREAGYAEQTTKNPDQVTKSKGFQELLEQYLPDDLIAQTHSSIIGAKRVDHMVFPKAMKDKEITEIVESVEGCKVRKFQHGETANHVWFWSPDQVSRLSAVKEAYKIKNKYAPEEHIITNKLTDEQIDRIIKD